MKSHNFLVRLVVNITFSLVIGTAVLSLIGYLLAGTEGLRNGAILGAIIGVLGGLSSLGYYSGLGWYTGTIRRYGQNRHQDL